MSCNTFVGLPYDRSRTPLMASPWQDLPEGISRQILAKEAPIDERSDTSLPGDHLTRGARWDDT